MHYPQALSTNSPPQTSSPLFKGIAALGALLVAGFATAYFLSNAPGLRTASIAAMTSGSALFIAGILFSYSKQRSRPFKIAEVLNCRLSAETAGAIKTLSTVGAFVIAAMAAGYFAYNLKSLDTGCTIGLGAGLGLMLLGPIFSHYKSKERHENAWEITLFAAILIAGLEGALINHFVAHGSFVLTGGLGALGAIGLSLAIAAAKQTHDSEKIDQKMHSKKLVRALQNSRNRKEAASRLKEIARYDAWLRGDAEKLAEATRAITRFRNGTCEEAERSVTELMTKPASKGRTRTQVQEEYYREHRPAAYATFKHAQKTLQELETLTPERQVQLCDLALQSNNEPLLLELIEQDMFKGREEEIGDFALEKKNPTLVGALLDKGILALEGLLNRIIILKQYRDADVALMVASKGGTSQRLAAAYYEEEEWKLVQQLEAFNSRELIGFSEQEQALMRKNLLWALCMTNKQALVSQMLPFYAQQWTFAQWHTFFTLQDAQGRTILERAILEKQETLTETLLEQWDEQDIDVQPDQLETLFTPKGDFSAFTFAALSGQFHVVEVLIQTAKSRHLEVPLKTPRNTSLLLEVLARRKDEEGEEFVHITSSLVEHILTLSPERQESEIFALIEALPQENLSEAIADKINHAFKALTSKYDDQMLAFQLPQRFPPNDYPKLYHHLFKSGPIERAKREVNRTRLLKLQEIAERAEIPVNKLLPSNQALIQSNLNDLERGGAQLRNLSPEIMAAHIFTAHRQKKEGVVAVLIHQIKQEGRFEIVMKIQSKPQTLGKYLEGQNVLENEDEFLTEPSDDFASNLLGDDFVPGGNLHPLDDLNSNKL